MTEPSTHINYTFEDIQRYLQGKMSAAEMHAMEKASLQDPFLADAIEGFSEASGSVAEKHLNEISAALIGEKRNSKVVAFNRKTQWMRIAALVIVLAGIGIIGSYVFNRSNQRENVAQIKKDETSKMTSPVLKDSQENKTAPGTLKGNEEKNNTVQSQKKQEDSKAKSRPAEVTNGAGANSESDDANQQADVAANLRVVPSPGVNEEIQKDKEANSSVFNLSANSSKDSLTILKESIAGLSVSPVTISGKVLDENGQPIPGVIVQSVDKKETVLSNSDGDFSLHKQDSLADISASAIGFRNENARLKTGSANLIVLQSDSRTLNEVVVTGLGVKKNDSSNNKGVAPVGGWENFNHYVQKQLNIDTTADYYSYGNNDLVELEFSIDKAGNPVNIKFLQSLDAQRNARALDILKHGPRWMATENKKVRLRISF